MVLPASSRFFACLALASLSACAQSAGSGGDGDEGKFEAINDDNDPFRLDPSFERNWEKLPLKSEDDKLKHVPWPGDYWAMASDGINHRWNGSKELSPAEKYEAAFNRTGVVASIREHLGKEAAFVNFARLADGTSVTRAECLALEATDPAKYDECIAIINKSPDGWWGICDGWSAASVSEKAPLYPVVWNNVTFYPGDIEGLVSTIYSSGGDTPAVILSNRCRDEDIEVDANGRPTKASCRDTNPGTLHLVATNMLGLRGRSFVEDRTIGQEVWNQPVRGYEITEQRVITKAEATSLVGHNPGASTYLMTEQLDIDEWRKGEMEVPDGGFIHFFIQSGDATLYVNLRDPVTLKGPKDMTCELNEPECTIRAKAGTKVYWMLVSHEKSNYVTLHGTVPDPGAPYAFNPAATKFLDVTMELRYITESRPATESHLDNIDRYTRTDTYTYILELDDQGTILGGEYYGDSHAEHPDFLWAPTGAPSRDLHGISYDLVRWLIDESQFPQDPNNPDPWPMTLPPQ